MRRITVADEHKLSSQNGEDGVIAAIVDTIGDCPHSFVEIGAGDGSEGNCVSLADAGWSGTFIEADCDRYRDLAQRWWGHPGVEAVLAWVTAANVDGLFIGYAPTVLSLDIDGNDYWVWEAMSLRPLVVVVEYNAHLGYLDLVQPYEPDWVWDGTRFFGASLTAMNRVATLRGYRFVYAESAGVNAFFVRDDVADLFDCPDSLPAIEPSHRLPVDEKRRAYVVPDGDYQTA